jgi:hypothetical protein
MEKQDALLQDYNKCLADNVPLHCWIEDIQDDPDAYEYTAEEAKGFIFGIGITPPDSLPLQEDCFEH